MTYVFEVEMNSTFDGLTDILIQNGTDVSHPYNP